MPETRILYLKDIPVLRSIGFEVEVLQPDKLPYGLRYADVDFDDLFHGWTETRILNIGRSNAKKILAGYGLPQGNSYQIANLLHFVSLNDCYWLKSENDAADWQSVSLFSNRISEEVAGTALFGKNLLFSGRILSPEISTQGLSAKAWYRDSSGTLWLYKVGRKEIAASAILQALGIRHVPYVSAMGELSLISDEKHSSKITSQNEILVKCPIITNERKAIVTWDEWQVFCDRNDRDPFRTVENEALYHEMRAADYILGNEDRHGENWGFFMDNETCQISEIHPLFDHDHAFSNDDDLISQTSKNPETLWEAAAASLKYLHTLPLKNILQMTKPEGITQDEWNGVLERTKRCIDKN